MALHPEDALAPCPSCGEEASATGFLQSLPVAPFAEPVPVAVPDNVVSLCVLCCQKAARLFELGLSPRQIAAGEAPVEAQLVRLQSILERTRMTEPNIKSSGAVEVEISAPQTELVPIENIEPNPFQPRLLFGEAEMEDLANSIKEHGLIYAVTGRPKPDAIGVFQIMDGERRFRALQRLGAKTVPLTRREATDHEMARLAIVANRDRVNNNPIEMARAYRRLIDEFGESVEQVAQGAGKSRPVISNLLRLLDLPDEVQLMLSAGELSEAHGRALATYKDWPRFVLFYAAKIRDKSIPTKEVEKGISLTYDEKAVLAREKVLVSTYNCGYSVEQARQNHPGAFFKAVDDYEAFCLDVALHLRLLAEAQAEKKREQEATAQQATQATQAGQQPGAGVGQLPRVSDMDYNTYCTIGKPPPPGCSKECKCRGKALSYNGSPIEICTDPKRHRKLIANETRAKNDVQRADNERKMNEIATYLDGMREQEIETPDVSTAYYATLQRAAALAAHALMRQAPLSILKKVAIHLDLAPEVFDPAKFHASTTADVSRSMLAEMDVRTVLALATEVALRNDADMRISGYGYAALDEWFKKGLPPVPASWKKDVGTGTALGPDDVVDRGNVKALINTEATDINYKLALERATRREIELAIEECEAGGGINGKHVTRLKKLRSQIKKIDAGFDMAFVRQLGETLAPDSREFSAKVNQAARKEIGAALELCALGDTARHARLQGRLDVAKKFVVSIVDDAT